MPRATPDPEFWAGRRVLVTGHTGFKGRWLTLWLGALGAEVTGFSRREGGDVTDPAAVRAAVADSSPRGRLPPRRARHRAARLRGPCGGLHGQRGRHRQPPAGRARGRRRARGDRRHLRQVLPRPGRRAALPRGRPARRLRPVLELEGRPGAGDRGVPRLARAAGGERPRRQRDRRRRRDPRPPASRPRPRRPDRRADRDPRPGRPPAVAARARPARGLSAAGRAPRGGPRLRHRVQLRPRRRAAHGRHGSPSGCATPGRAGSTCASPSARRGTRRRSPASTPPAPGTRLGWRPPWDLAAAIDATVEWELADRDLSLEQIERHGAMARA